MLFGPQRGSFFTIFDKFAGTFGVPIVVLIAALIFGNREAVFENGIILLIVIAGPASKLLNYFFTYYSIDEEKFHISSGIFNKKETEIPIDRITTVDFTQNIIFRMADVYHIRIDNASNYGGNGKGTVQLALKREDALRLKGLLISGSVTAAGAYQPADDAPYLPSQKVGDKSIRSTEISVKEISVPAGKIMIMGALQSKGNALAQIFSALALLGGMVNIIEGKEDAVESRIVEMILSVPGLGIAAGLLAAFIIISTVLGAVFAVIKYYGFKIIEEEKSIILEYGLFTRKSYSLLKEKISGIEYVQSLPMTFLRVGYLNVMAVGYGDEPTEEKALMYPLIGEKEAEKLICGCIPQLAAGNSDFFRAYPAALRYFFICPRVFFTLLLVAAAAVWELIMRIETDMPEFPQWGWYCLIFIIICTICSVCKEYRNTGTSADGERISFVTGGFTKTTARIKTSMTESVTDTASVWKRKKKISTIKLGILAPLGDSVKIVRNMPVEAFENIKNMIHY